MLITCPPRQPFKNGPRSARTATPTPPNPRTTEAPQATVGGNGAILRGTPNPQGTVSRSLLAPKGRGLERLSRHVFLGEMAGLRG